MMRDDPLAAMESTTGDRDETGRDGNRPLLAVEDLQTHIHTDEGVLHAVDGVSFSIDRGETVGLVGESGSGKSVTCQSLTGLVPQPPAKFVGGSVAFDGHSLLGADEKRLRSIRGDRIAHLFQNPQQALDPVYSVGEQLREAITIHERDAGADIRERSIALLRRLGIPNPATRIDDYPHEFSGGMAQRIALAIALAANPDLLVADEPTTAVDVTVQARLIELLRELAAGGMAMLLVTHDLRVISALADRVLVMFGGTIVERGPVGDVFSTPSHPYTQALFESTDRITRRADRSARGDIPTSGCRFRHECQYAIDACATDEQPPVWPVEDDSHAVSCVYYAPDRDPGAIQTAGQRVRPGGVDE